MEQDPRTGRWWLFPNAAGPTSGYLRRNVTRPGGIEFIAADRIRPAGAKERTH
jgi:hypothetical protein